MRLYKGTYSTLHGNMSSLGIGSIDSLLLATCSTSLALGTSMMLVIIPS